MEVNAYLSAATNPFRVTASSRQLSAMISMCWLFAGLLLLLPGRVYAATSWDGNRWFQVEVSIFTNQQVQTDDLERWSPERLSLRYPRRVQRLSSFADLFVVNELEARLRGQSPIAGDAPLPVPELTDARQQRLLNTGPLLRQPLYEFRLPDPERDAFLLLAPEQSEFQQTNRTLERSAENRLLFHGVWRQPVLDQSQAAALIIEGGQRFAGMPELQGSLTIRFNQNQDRVVIDTDLWLVEFVVQKENDLNWPIPPVAPGGSNSTNPQSADSGDGQLFDINRVVQFVQSREMRSNEFHYLDHPLIGVVVSVKPYNLPLPLTQPGQ